MEKEEEDGFGSGSAKEDDQEEEKEGHESDVDEGEEEEQDRERETMVDPRVDYKVLFSINFPTLDPLVFPFPIPPSLDPSADPHTEPIQTLVSVSFSHLFLISKPSSQRQQQTSKRMVLDQAERERALDHASDWNQKCLFCNKTWSTRKTLFGHMFCVHGFNPGLPDNLVFIDCFLTLLRSRLDS